MDPRSLGRYLAPLALVAVVVATIIVIGSAGGGGSGAQQEKGGGSQLSQQERVRRRARRQARRQRTTYTVRQGDTIDSIATRTRVTRENLIRLNPDVDPQALQPGQKIKLR